MQKPNRKLMSEDNQYRSTLSENGPDDV